MAQDPPDVGQKAHVEHVVRLVEDQHLQPGKVDSLSTNMVKQSTGAGHDDLGTPSQLYHLRVDTYPAVDGDASQAGLPPLGLDGLVNLFRQLPCGRDDQGANPSAGTPPETVEDWQGKRGGLAGAGLGQTHDITPLHDRGNRLGLNRCWCNKARRGDTG